MYPKEVLKVKCESIGLVEQPPSLLVLYISLAGIRNYYVTFEWSGIII